MSLTFNEAKTLWLLGLDKLKAAIPQQDQPENPLHTYAISVKYAGTIGGRPAYVVFLGYATSNEWDADATDINLYHKFVKKEYWTPQNPIGGLIFNQSYLRWYKEDLKFLEPIIDHLKKTLLDGWVIHTDRPEYRRLLMPMRDISEKLGIMQEAYESISTAPLLTSVARVKADFYFFIWSIKSLNDSLAVFLKNWYSLPEESGAIDLGRGVGAKGTFLISLQKKNKSLADEIVKEFQQWVNEVTNYRMHTIHRFGVFVSMKQGEGYKVPRNPELDPYQAEQMSDAEANTLLEPIVPFVEGWRTKSWALTRLVVREISESL
ncbi:MAG TPA: hypothetical protein VGR56_08320 [Nitrososphaerales archaeon]|nr:hypothetical protein [Nitrososphaerales archaeon]